MRDFLPQGHFDALATGRAGQDQFAKLVAQEQARIDGAQQSVAAEQKISAFINEQPGSIRQQAGGAVDQQALTALQEWRHANPSPSSAQLAHYEASLASVLHGRRHDETLSQFQQRTNRGAPAASAGEQQADDGLSQHLPVNVEAEDLEGLQRIVNAADALRVDDASVNHILTEVAKTAQTPNPLPENYTSEPFEMYGFTIDPAEIAGELFEGFMLDRYDPQLATACKLARQHGIGQEQLTGLIRAYFAEAS